jgi:hypothetical protein
MSINPRSVALQGIGFATLAVALQGVLSPQLPADSGVGRAQGIATVHAVAERLVGARGQAQGTCSVASLGGSLFQAEGQASGSSTALASLRMGAMCDGHAAGSGRAEASGFGQIALSGSVPLWRTAFATETLRAASTEAPNTTAEAVCLAASVTCNVQPRECGAAYSGSIVTTRFERGECVSTVTRRIATAKVKQDQS